MGPGGRVSTGLRTRPSVSGHLIACQRAGTIGAVAQLPDRRPVRLLVGRPAERSLRVWFRWINIRYDVARGKNYLGSATSGTPFFGGRFALIVRSGPSSSRAFASAASKDGVTKANPINAPSSGVTPSVTRKVRVLSRQRRWLQTWVVLRSSPWTRTIVRVISDSG